MWIEIKKAPNLMVAEMWKDLFEGEGVPTRLLIDPASDKEGESATYRVLIPRDRDHVIAEILRKI